MAPITFGSMTMSASMPRGLTTSGDTGIGFITQMNSAFDSGQSGQIGAGSNLTSEVAADYKSIRANMAQPKNRSWIGRIADAIVNNKLNSATLK